MVDKINEAAKPTSLENEKNKQTKGEGHESNLSRYFRPKPN